MRASGPHHLFWGYSIPSNPPGKEAPKQVLTRGEKWSSYVTGCMVPPAIDRVILGYRSVLPGIYGLSLYASLTIVCSVIYSGLSSANVCIFVMFIRVGRHL